MKKIYYIKFNYDPDQCLEETIKHDFDDFSLEKHEIIFVDDNNRNMFTSDLEFAKDWSEDDLTSLTIMEYTLSEDDFLKLLIDGQLKSNPTNSWYYWWDEDQQKLKEIPKIFI